MRKKCEPKQLEGVSHFLLKNVSQMSKSKLSDFVTGNPAPDPGHHLNRDCRISEVSGDDCGHEGIAGPESVDNVNRSVGRTLK